MVKGMAVGGLAMVVLGSGAVTGYRALTKPAFAEIVAVKEIAETAVTPREKCEDVQVQLQAPVNDEHRIAGSAVGGMAGACSEVPSGVVRGRRWPRSPEPPPTLPAIRFRRRCRKRMS